MTDTLEALKLLGPALSDPWYMVDDQDRIVDFNPAFYALFPRATGRNLKKMGCRDAAGLPPCATDRCLRVACTDSGPLRLDELDVEIGGESLRLIVSAVPVPLAAGGQGALIVLRNVTDDARVQSRYQTMMEEAEKERAHLQQQLEERTRELLAANEELNRLERELGQLRRGGV